MKLNQGELLIIKKGLDKLIGYSLDRLKTEKDHEFVDDCYRTLEKVEKEIYNRRKKNPPLEL